MPDQLTPDQLREHAAEIMLDHARDVERLSIREHLDDHDLGDDTRIVDAIQELISTADITIDWPNSPGQTMDVGADDQLATVTRERDEALQDAQSLTDDLAAVRTERDQIGAELAASRAATLQAYSKGAEDTLASVTAKDLAIARQALAHSGTGYVPPWHGLTSHEQQTSTIEAGHWLAALRNTLDSGTAPVPGSSRRVQEPGERVLLVEIRLAIRQGLMAYPNHLSEGMDAAAMAVARLLDQRAAGESQASEPAPPKLAQGGIIRRDTGPIIVGEQTDGCVVPRTIPGQELYQALVDAGILHPGQGIRRIVIDSRAGHPVVIHIERKADKRLLDVVPALDGAEVRDLTETAAAELERPIDLDDRTPRPGGHCG